MFKECVSIRQKSNLCSYKEQGKKNSCKDLTSALCETSDGQTLLRSIILRYGICVYNIWHRKFSIMLEKMVQFVVTATSIFYHDITFEWAFIMEITTGTWLKDKSMMVIQFAV